MSRPLCFSEKLLLKLFCFPPPGRTYDPDVDDRQTHQPTQATALQHLEASILNLSKEERARIHLLDIGCGKGQFVLKLAESGIGEAVGMDIRPIFRETEETANRKGISHRVRFTTKPLTSLPPTYFDIITSQDSFEHFDNPLGILLEARKLLKPGGKFYVSWGPPWYHPRGVHMFFMMKRPWAHLFFSERTIMNVRALYKSDGAKQYHEVKGGLNQMTVSRFIRLTHQSGFQIEKLQPIPIRGLQPLVWLPGVREFFTSIVHAILVK